MILGVRAHDFGKLTVEELAEKISEKGLTRIQLALSKAVAGFSTDVGFLSPGLACHIRETFYRKNIQIAILGCYINPIHPDETERKKHISRFKEHLRYAREFGCSIVATETGHVAPDNPEEKEKAFQLLVHTIGELVEEAEKFGVLVGIEGGDRDTISSPIWMKRLLDTIPSNHLQVVFDPLNFIPEEDYQKQDDMIKESFALFGDRIAAVHAKDFVMRAGKKIVIDSIGEGLLNYELLLTMIKKKKPYITVSMEGTRPETMDGSIRFLQDLYLKV